MIAAMEANEVAVYIISYAYKYIFMPIQKLPAQMPQRCYPKLPLPMTCL